MEGSGFLPVGISVLCSVSRAPGKPAKCRERNPGRGGGGGKQPREGLWAGQKRDLVKKKKKDSMDISGHGNRSGWFATQVA